MDRILLVSVILVTTLLCACSTPEKTITITQPIVTVTTSIPAVTVTKTLPAVTITKTLPAVTITTIITPTIVPTPTAEIGHSRSNPVGVDAPLAIAVSSVGSAGTEYNIRVTLLEFVRGDDAWNLVAEKAYDFNKPKAGFEYIFVKVRFEYLGGLNPDKAFDVSSAWFDVISGKGQEYSKSSFDVSPPDPQIRTSLYSGASHEGWMTFSISKEDSKPLLTFGRSYDGTGGIWFKLY